MTQLLKKSWKTCQVRREQGRKYKAGALLLCLLAILVASCSSNQSQQPGANRKTVQTDSGDTITYSTLPQDVLIRLFFGGGKVGSLQVTPEISIYGNGTFITGSGLQLQQGTLSDDALHNLLHQLTSTDNLLKLQRQTFDDIPDQNITLLQVALNGRNYQYVYGPFENLQESSQDAQDYHLLGNAISSIRQALNGPETAYTSQNQALLVYQTSRLDFTAVQNNAILQWPISDISLFDAAAYECGLIQPDPNNPRPNLDNGCLTYTVPSVAIEVDKTEAQRVANLLHDQQQTMFLEDGYYYVVMLRSLLPDEIAQHQLAMYGSNNQTYRSVPLKTGPIPTATTTTSS